METSLRSRPAKAPPRKVARTPTKLSKPGAPVTRERSKNRIDDKIKKRMSARYAEISSPTQLTEIPGMPSMMGLIPAGEGAVSPRDADEEVRGRADSRGEAKASLDDKKFLSAEDFDPAAFLKLKLANSTEVELKSLESSLRNVAKDTSSELQRSVFKNYAEFVLISKEISVLENEMLELKELLSDYKSMPSTLHIPDPTSTSSTMLSTYKRSSIADLRVLYFNQMQTLHATIEGSSKFVPTTPGRHVVGEMENLYSLNAATYKVAGKVKFVLLDDAVLVARRRRRNAGAGRDGGSSTVNEGKLVAERCWPLNEMLVLDTKDSPTMTNVFKIRHGKETHVYRTESPADKKALLSQFRQVAEELSQRRRKEREGEHERRKSVWQGGAQRSEVPPMPEWMVDIAKKGGDISGVGSSAKERAERDARWVGEWSDELIVAIALKEWNRAVDLIDQGQARVATNPLLVNKLPQLTSQLVLSLLESLSHPSNRKSCTVNLISLLNHMKAGTAARNTFLEMRAKVVHGLTRKIRFDGDIRTYVGELAVVYFTGIKHTADWYLASFKENEVASSFIMWTKRLLGEYATIFRKQVYSKDIDPKVVQDAINITHAQSRKLLQEYGLDFRYMLDEILVEKPKDPPEAKISPSLHDHNAVRTSEQSLPSTAKSARRHPNTSPEDGMLPGPPTPPPLGLPPPPVNRRKSPTPTGTKVASPPPSLPISDAPHLPQSAGADLQPPPLGLKAGITTHSPGSVAYSPRLESGASSAPLFSRANQSPYTPLSALRARTPVSAIAHHEQNSLPPSAPVSQTNFASPLQPMSAMPFKMRDRSNSVKSKESSVLESTRESNMAYEQPTRARASPGPRTPGPPPLRSANRPGSTMGQRTPVAVAQHEGMI